LKEKLLNAIIELFKVKTIITLMTVSTACYLAIADKLDKAVFVGIVSSVITYYFGRRKEEEHK